MAAYPRTFKPVAASTLMVRGAAMAFSATGQSESRAFGQGGFMWTEEYLFPSGNADARELLAFLMAAWRNGTVFTAQHPLYTGIMGGGTGTITVNGANQTGTSLITTGWGGTNPVLKKGDLIKLVGYGVRVVQADVTRSVAAATITIDPPIYVGNSPANGASVAYGAVDFDVRLAEAPTWPTLSSTMASNMKVTFAEATPK